MRTVSKNVHAGAGTPCPSSHLHELDALHLPTRLALGALMLKLVRAQNDPSFLSKPCVANRRRAHLHPLLRLLLEPMLELDVDRLELDNALSEYLTHKQTQDPSAHTQRSAAAPSTSRGVATSRVRSPRPHLKLDLPAFNRVLYHGRTARTACGP